MDMERIRSLLASGEGPRMRIMEICGSHTEAVARYGIPSLVSDRFTLLTGPGCPVCVATSSYVDRLIELARAGSVIVTFGDLIRVPGSRCSLAEIQSEGARVEMVYAPMDILPLAEAEPEKEFVFAAVGFETTAPVYALLAEEIVTGQIGNVRLLTALKTMPPVVECMLAEGAPVDGFLAPGHVCAVTGSGVFESIAETYGIPFAVSGFRGSELLVALYSLQEHAGQGIVTNCYPAVVSREGNKQAQEQVRRFFQPGDAVWRGLGRVPDSGLYLREEFRFLDAGSSGLDADSKKNPACHCDRVLTGRETPQDCPLFDRACRPGNPQGACMVSAEGSCHSQYVHRKFTKNC